MPTTLPELPESFKGDFREFFKTYIEPSLAALDEVRIIHNALLAFFKNQQGLAFIVRNFSDFQMAGPENRVGSLKFRVADNEPALWCYARAVCGETKAFIPSFHEIIQKQCFPISMVRSEGESLEDWSCWGRQAWEADQVGAKGWHHAHLMPAAEGIDRTLNIENLKLRMWRFLHPMNHLLMPSHFSSQRVHIRKLDGTYIGDLSKNLPGLVPYVFTRYSEIYEPLWKEFSQQNQISKAHVVIPAQIPLQFVKRKKVDASQMKTAAPPVNLKVATLVIGKKYTTNQIVELLGGNINPVINTSGGKATWAKSTIGEKYNPEGPDILGIHTGPARVKAALAWSKASLPIPYFSRTANETSFKYIGLASCEVLFKGAAALIYAEENKYPDPSLIGMILRIQIETDEA